MSKYENVLEARVYGFESELNYSFNKRFELTVNGTYQDMRNNQKMNGDRENTLYSDRIPNMPFLFGNAAFNSNFVNVFKKKDKLSVYLSTLFVEAFYLNWPSQGFEEFKYDIPRQVSVDSGVTYSWNKSRYNISLECLNVLDAKRYDNFNLQKPGRSFSAKFRMFFSKG